MSRGRGSVVVRVNPTYDVEAVGKEDTELTVGLEATDVGALADSIPTPIPRRPAGTKDSGRRPRWGTSRTWDELALGFRMWVLWSMSIGMRESDRVCLLWSWLECWKDRVGEKDSRALVLLADVAVIGGEPGGGTGLGAVPLRLMRKKNMQSYRLERLWTVDMESGKDEKATSVSSSGLILPGGKSSSTN